MKMNRNPVTAETMYFVFGILMLAAETALVLLFVLGLS